MSGYLEIKNKKIGLGAPKICIPLMGRTETDILSEADKIISASRSNRIDMVELRGDFFEGLSDYVRLDAILKKLSEKMGDMLLLFTIRSEREGGEPLSFGSPTVNEINAHVISSGLVELVDVELLSGDEEVEGLVRLAAENKTRIIMSNHDFERTPPAEELEKRLMKMSELGADIAKLAMMPENKRQLLDVFSAVENMSGRLDIPIVAISMGGLGGLSRICGQVFGSAITFAALERSSAPGQIPLPRLEEALDIVEQFCI